MKSKLICIMAILLVFSLKIGFAQSLEIEELNINTEYTLEAGNTPYDTSIDNRINKFYYRDFGPYTKVYKIKVSKGQRYTMKVVFNGDGNYANVELVGENPLSSNTEVIYNQGTYANVLGFSGFVDSLKENFTYSTNFSINTLGDGEYLYLISYFKEASGSLKVSINNPPVSDELVDLVSDDGLSWGTYLDAPLQLTRLDDISNTIKFKIGSNMASVNDSSEILDVAASVVDGRSLVPLRFIGEKLGADIAWDASESKVTYSTDDTIIILWINKNIALVNGEESILDVAPFIVSGRTVVPLRFVSENLGADVEWIAETKEILITK